ncbi:MAG: hypothetical protein LBL66_09160 [Clostridiales bacterium]|jgi:hypothetical protein|nr:hypothetical protein [Clostridiales bacterium]
MNTKNFNFYKDLFAFAASDYLNSPETNEKFFKKAIDFNFGVAAELWQFVAASNAKDAQAYKMIGPNVLKVFHAANSVKTRTLLIGSDEVRDVVYCGDAKAGEGLSGEIALYYLSGLKVAESDALLKSLSKNINFGPIFKKLLERLFDAVKERNGGKAVLPRRFADLLLAHANNIKTFEKALVTQRIKEIM